MDKINEEVEGQSKMKVARIVRKGQVFSKEYTRMVKRNACVVLFVDGKVGERVFCVEQGVWMHCSCVQRDGTRCSETIFL